MTTSKTRLLVVPRAEYQVTDTYLTGRTSCVVGAPPSMKIAWRIAKSFIFSMHSGSLDSSALQGTTHAAAILPTLEVGAGAQAPRGQFV